jgi:hypothetical protein
MIPAPRPRLYRFSQPHWTWDYTGRWEACDLTEFMLWLARNQRENQFKTRHQKLLALSCPKLQDLALFGPTIYKN